MVAGACEYAQLHTCTSGRMYVFLCRQSSGFQATAERGVTEAVGLGWGGEDLERGEWADSYVQAGLLFIPGIVSGFHDQLRVSLRPICHVKIISVLSFRQKKLPSIQWQGVQQLLTLLSWYGVKSGSDNPAYPGCPEMDVLTHMWKVSRRVGQVA